MKATHRKANRMMRIRNTLAVACLAIGAIGATACDDASGDDGQYRGVCVAPNTQVYLDPSQCGADGSDSDSAVWDYILLTTFMNNMNTNPGYYNAGQTVTHVVHHLPANSTSRVEYSASDGRAAYTRKVRTGTSGKVTKSVPAARPKPARAPAAGTVPSGAKVPDYGTAPKIKVRTSGKCC